MDFIETKFSPPLLPTNLLVKQKLIDQIESFQYVRLVLVSAPAGYGKTTFIANWLDSGRKTTAWLSLDSIDNRFPLFLEYLIAACRRVLSGFGELIQNRMNYDLNLSLNSICANLVNELSRAGTDITLVFDDFHVITDTSIIDLIQRLLEHLPPNVHLIVISRETPPFHLSRFRSMKQVMDIGPEQLHFTEKETAIYLNDIYGFSLKKEELATLCGKTEGWISGLQMAAISLQTSQNAKGFLNGINKASTSISDYLLEEVFDKQDASVRDFLLSSAIVNRFCDSICQALTQEETVNKAQERILMIQKLNLFVIPLDGSGHWFRYHHMFRDFLLQRLQRRFPERMKQLHSTASHWYEQNGFLSESIHHAFQADLPDRLHGLIKNNAFAVLEAGDLHTLNNWFDRLPSEIVKQTPWLSVVYSYVMLFIGERKGLDFWLDHTEKMIPSITNVDQARTLKGHCHSIRAYLTALEGDVIGAMGILENALKLLPENDFYSVGFCQWVLAVVYRYSGRLEEAVSTVRKAINTLKEGKCLHLLLLAYGELIDIRIIQGQLRHAHALCEEALSYLSEAGKENVEENMYVGYLFIRLGYIWYEWNNREKAAYYTQLGADLITKWGKLGLYTLAAMALARNQYHLKDFTGMWRTLQKAFSRAEAFPGILSRFIEAEEAWAHLNTGNQAAAITWKENFEKAPARDELLPNHVNHQWLVYIEILQSLGEFDKALKIETIFIKRTQSAGASGILLWLLVMKTLSLSSLERKMEASRTLEESIHIAYPHGYLRVFLDKGKPLIPLLRQLRETTQNEALVFIDSLLDLFSLESTSGELSTNQFTPESKRLLTIREVQIMTLIADGLSNLEISENLHISLGTVKWHIHNIFEKLEVPNRTSALKKTFGKTVL